MIVNTDADNQYYGGDIPKLVEPILAGRCRHGDRRPRDRPDRALLPAQEAPPAPRQRRGAARLGHQRARHHLRLPRLQPRGRAADPGGLEVHLHAGDDHPGRQADRGGRPRPDPHQRPDARIAPVPLDVVLRAAKHGLDLPRLRALRAAAAVPCRGHRGRAGGGGDLGALPVVLLRGREQRPHPVADPRLHAVHRRRAVRRARACWATSWPAAGCSSSASSNACAASSCTLGVEPSHYEPGAERRRRRPPPARTSGRATGKTEEREALKL